MEHLSLNPLENNELPKKEAISEFVEFSDQEKDIEEVFKINPELEAIGSKEQYQEYLKTIFPESKIQDIVWHGTRNSKLENFEDKSLYGNDYGGSYGNGVYFTPKIKLAQKYERGGKIVPAVINVKNPQYFNNGTLKDFIPNISDSSIVDYDTKDGLIDEIVVFEPEQIHILGSKDDIEKFKEFVSKKDKDDSETEGL